MRVDLRDAEALRLVEQPAHAGARPGQQRRAVREVHAGPAEGRHRAGVERRHPGDRVGHALLPAGVQEGRQRAGRCAVLPVVGLAGDRLDLHDRRRRGQEVEDRGQARHGVTAREAQRVDGRGVQLHQRRGGARHQRVVHAEQLAVAAEAHVELHGPHAVVAHVGKAGQGVLRHHRPGTAMPDHRVGQRRHATPLSLGVRPLPSARESMLGDPGPSQGKAAPR